MADEVLYSGVACITDLMVKDGLINLDFADVRSVMREMGKAMMGTGEASGDKRAIEAAEKAISNPLLDDVCMRGARGLLISITGGRDMTLFEVDEAASRVREEVEADANIIFGATFDESLEGIIRVSVVATGIEQERAQEQVAPPTAGMAELTRRLKSVGAPAPVAVAPQQSRSACRAGAGPAAAARRTAASRPTRWKGSSRSSPCRSSRGAPQRPDADAAARCPVAQPAKAGRPGVRIGPFRPDPVADRHAPAGARGRARRAPTKRRARPPRSTSSRRRPSGRRRCSRACRGWRTSRRWRSGSSGRSRRLRAPRKSAGRAGCSRGSRAGLPAATIRSTNRRRREPEVEPRSCSAAPAGCFRTPAPAAEFAKAPQPRRMGEGQAAAGSLDPRGRPQPIEPNRDDHLEIPAFLRRQSS